jgi:hypothetical protein
MEDHMKDEGIQKYLDALEAGDSGLLEELAIKAGYTERYDGALSFKNDRAQLENEAYRFGVTIEAASEEEVCEFERLVKRFFKRYVEKLGGVLWMESDQKSLMASNADSVPKDGVRSLAIALLEAAVEALQRTNDIGNYDDCSFVRVRQGQYPRSHSFVAFIAVTSDIGKMKHKRRWLIHDAYDNDPLIEGKLDHGVKTSHWDELCDGKNRRKELEEEGGGTLLHGILDDERTRWKTENLIYGQKVVEYLYAHSQGQISDLFPLSMISYERLIARRQASAKKFEMFYANAYSKYDFERVRRMVEEIMRGKTKINALTEFIRSKMQNPENDKAVVNSMLDAVLRLEKIASENNELIRRYHSAYPDV